MNIEIVADKIMELKRREAIAKEERATLEEQLAKEISDRVEGTASLVAGSYKVTVTSKLTRTLDYPAYQAIEADIPEGVRCALQAGTGPQEAALHGRGAARVLGRIHHHQAGTAGG